ncbi:MAG TPA: hemerythrin domain-containing protein [Allosphingosinicella sp.]|jgi:hypothetical protein
MASIAHQSIAELGGRSSVLVRQKRDHIKLDGLLQELGSARADEQSSILLRIYRLVFAHAFAEEAVLWPVIRRLLPDGHALTLKVELEHQQINALVTELETLPAGSPAHRQTLDRVVELLKEDVRDEEDILLPRLQARLSPAKLRLLGLAWDLVRAIAPTRAHPIVSRRPPGNILAALPLALLDRLRDSVDARVQQSGGPVAPLARRLSISLRRSSHAVERLPGMKRGEDAATRQRGHGSNSSRTLYLVGGLGLAAALIFVRSRAGTPVLQRA